MEVENVVPTQHGKVAPGTVVFTSESSAGMTINEVVAVAKVMGSKRTSTLAVRCLLTFSCLVLAFGSIASLPWFLLPLGWIALGTSFFGLSAIAASCSFDTFSDNHIVNHAVGWLCSLFLMIPFESWGLDTPSAVKIANNAYLWFASSPIEWVQANFFSTIARKRDVFSKGFTYVAQTIFLYATFYFGIISVFKFYLIPWIVYHVYRSTALRIRSCLDNNSESTFMNGDFLQSLIRKLPNVSMAHVRWQVGEVVASMSELTNHSRSVFAANMYGRLFGWEVVPRAEIQTLFRDQLRAFGMFQKLSNGGVKKNGAPSKNGNRNRIHWFNAVYLGSVHVAAIYGLLCLPSTSWKTIAFAFLTWKISSLGGTVGLHRLWSHRTYRAKTPYRIMMMLMTCVSNQGSIFHWCRDHRVHHKFVDSETDPHNASRGFFFSHCGWLLVQKNRETQEAGKTIYMKDLVEDPIVMWQKKNYSWVAPLMCFGIPSLIPVLWGDGWNGMWVASFLRYAWSLQTTWLVNSAAHLWETHKYFGFDPRPYNKKILPVENVIVSVLNSGEGWHNYHHAYAYDYATNEFGWWQYNPSKVFIDFFAFIGQVSDRRRARLKSPDDSVLPLFTRDEVRINFESQGAQMMIVGDYVYDVTEFSDVHPGGSTILQKYLGMDATEAFQNGVHSHTDAAYSTLIEFRVGKLKHSMGDNKNITCHSSEAKLD